MGKKKRTTTVVKKSNPGRKVSKKVTPITHKRDKDLNFVVQINEPKLLRKDILEALREIIIFMQGYETFMAVQEEKVATFLQLQREIKSLNNLIDFKLRRHLPKGKLKGLVRPKFLEIKPESVKEKVNAQPIESPVREDALEVGEEPEKSGGSQLDDLELQLSDIENRLRSLK